MPHVVLPELYPKQYAAIYDPARFSVIEASTKAGKTVGCIVWQMERVLRDTRGAEHWWVAPVYQQARIAMKRAKRMLIDAGLREHVEANRSSMTLAFSNGATWAFKSADKPDNLYGEDVQDAVLDEASRMREEAWHAVRSTLTATRGPVRFIGNVKGRRNWFWRVARRAEQGEPDHGYHKLTAYDAVKGGVLAAEEIEQAQRDLPDHVFRELYLAEAGDDGGNPFGLDAIEKSVMNDWAPDPDAAVAWGVDLAKSVDWTVAIGLDEEGHPVAIDRYQAPWRETIRRVRDTIGKTFALVDSTGVGDPIVEQLQAEGCAVEGFRFSAGSKQQLMEGLAVDIQRGEIKIPEGALADELRAFTYTHRRTGVRYEAPTGLHDDCVMALGLARRAWRDRARAAPDFWL